VKRAVSQRKLLTDKKARDEAEAVAAALVVKEAECRRRLMIEQGRIVAKQASIIAKQWQTRRQKLAEADEKDFGSLLGRPESDQGLEIPAITGVPSAEKRSYMWMGPQSGNSLVDSMDESSTKGSYSELDIHTLDPFRDTTLIEMLILMKEEGLYPNLALRYREHLADLEKCCGGDGKISMANYFFNVVHTSSKKIQV